MAESSKNSELVKPRKPYICMAQAGKDIALLSNKIEMIIHGIVMELKQMSAIDRFIRKKNIGFCNWRQEHPRVTISILAMMTCSCFLCPKPESLQMPEENLHDSRDSGRSPYYFFVGNDCVIIERMAQTLANVKNDLCMRNEGEQKDACLLCPMNWVLIQKKCYYMPDKMLSWQESQRFCSAQNSSLAMPKTFEELELITCNFRRWITFSLWIGLSCSLKSNGRWVWLDNTTYSSYSSQCREIRCASFDYSPLLFTTCSTKLKLICQRLPINLPSIN
ncbi:C-type lectin domain family 12 member A-like [Leptodactylus fuscus]